MPGPLRQRIGIYGGTFDPIHLGHIAIAEDALQFAQLDQIIFLPAFSAPLRNSEAGNSPDQRFAMVERAIAKFPAFAVDNFEIQQGRRVYSIEAVRHFRDRFPEAELFFLIGGDQFEQLTQWKSLEELQQEVTFLCASRATEEKPENDSAPATNVVFLPSRRVDISATEIRERLLDGRSIRSLVPESVADSLDQYSREGSRD